MSVVLYHQCVGSGSMYEREIDNYDDLFFFEQDVGCDQRRSA
jgi:hypothetical protein